MITPQYIKEIEAILKTNGFKMRYTHPDHNAYSLMHLIEFTETN